MMRKPLISSTGLHQFTFLASHGLRSPLTAIRWSCGRLKKVEKHSPEAETYLHQIALNTTRLTRVLGAFFLLSRLQEQRHPFSWKLLDFHTMMQLSIPQEERTDMVMISGSPSVKLESDEEVLRTMLSCLLMGCFVAYNGEEPKPIHVRMEEELETVSATLTTEASLQLLQQMHLEKLHPSQEEEQFIGGTTGLLFTLALDLAMVLGGHLNVVEKDASFSVNVTLPKKRLQPGHSL